MNLSTRLKMWIFCEFLMSNPTFGSCSSFKFGDSPPLLPFFRLRRLLHHKCRWFTRFHRATIMLHSRNTTPSLPRLSPNMCTTRHSHMCMPLHHKDHQLLEFRYVHTTTIYFCLPCPNFFQLTSKLLRAKCGASKTFGRVFVAAQRDEFGLDPTFDLGNFLFRYCKDDELVL